MARPRTLPRDVQGDLEVDQGLTGPMDEGYENLGLLSPSLGDDFSDGGDADLDAFLRS